MAASDASDAYTTFTGVTRLRQGVTPTGQRIERPNSDPTPERLNVIPKPTSPVASGGGGGAALGRANTARSIAGGMGIAGPGPARGNSVRKPPSPMSAGAGGGPGGGRSPVQRTNTPPGQDGSAPPPSSKGPRLTEMYEDLIDGYADDAPPVPPMPEDKDTKRIQAWSRGAAGAPPPPSAGPFRQPSVSHTLYFSLCRRLTYYEIDPCTINVQPL